MQVIRMKKPMISLAEMRPDISAEWHPVKNGTLTPASIACNSYKKVWWVCPRGHEYEQEVATRVSKGCGCPFCSGHRVLEGFNDLQTVNPELASEWNYEKNGDLMPTQVSLHSNKRVWWKCRVCGNEWITQVNDRSRGESCPVCASKKRVKSFRENTYLRRGINDLATLCPDLVEEWEEDKNGDKTPNDYTTGSKELIWWKCKTCGHEWKASISNRATKKSGCPKCMQYNRTSFPEQALYYYISRVFSDTENSYTKPFRPRKMELDIFIPCIRTGIEYDGKAWHKGDGEKEKEKYLLCKDKGIRLIRVVESELASSDCDEFVLRPDLSDESLDEVIKTVLSLISDQQIEVNTKNDRSQIMHQYLKYIKGKSIAEKTPLDASEWDTELNGGITPEMVNAVSPRKYWWRCEKGHPYLMSPQNKTCGEYGCPVCSNHQLLRGFNDLQTKYPEIAKEWDAELNSPLLASDVLFGSSKKVWWRCPEGHSYSAKVDSRTRQNTGCPFCSGTQTLSGYNDFVTKCPETALKWDSEKNGEIDPRTLSPGSRLKVWWKCSVGHSWENTVSRQSRFDSCPVCSGRLLQSGVNDLEVAFPDLASEWDWEKNADRSPADYTRTSTERVWWKCKKCGTEWQQEIRVRISAKSGCPNCAAQKGRETRAKNTKQDRRDLVSLFPEIAAEWDYERNTGLDPSTLSPSSNHKVWWICHKGHHYRAWMSDRTGRRKTGCPYCAGKRKLEKLDEDWKPSKE